MSAEIDDRLQRAIYYIDHEVQKGYITGRFYKSIRVTSARPGELVLQFSVQEVHLNSVGFMHGGVLSILIDMLTFTAADTLFTKDQPLRGTSLELNAKYLHAIQKGETIFVKVEAVRSGKKFVVCKAELRNMDGRVMVLGSQTIYLIDPSRYRKIKGDPAAMQNSPSKL